MRDSGRWVSAVGAGAMALGALVGLSLVSGGPGGDGPGVENVPSRTETTVNEAEDGNPPAGHRPERALPGEFRTATAAALRPAGAPGGG
ncbi:hypothetical protein ACSMX9_23570 [Streptomyces sp. LE64]|uniref:hypothetical protein n=1 Tax=Streptomyces sp. LE64 TaxID=3448653 RepID=UPI0040416D24